MRFNFGTFKSFLKGIGYGKKWDSSVSKMNAGINKVTIVDDAGNKMQLVPVDKANTAEALLKRIVTAQAVDAAIAQAAETPVNTVFKAVQAAQAIPAKYTIGMIPGFKQFFDWINDKALSALKYVANEFGFQGVAKAIDNYQDIWDQGFKAIGNQQGYKDGNHDSWWIAKGKKVRVDKDALTYTNEVNTVRVCKAVLIQILDNLPVLALNQYSLSGSRTADAMAEAVTKYLTYLNFSQTLSTQAIADYLKAVANMYQFYITHKKWYQCRNTEVVKNSGYTFTDAYITNAVVNDNHRTIRTTHSALNDNCVWFKNYVADKVWEDVEMFLERQYLPKSIKEYIDYTCSSFWRYNKQYNTFISIDADTCVNAGSPTTTPEAKYAALKSAIESARTSVTSNMKGFLAKSGIEPLIIDEKFKAMRSKTGINKPVVRDCDEMMRSAINNVFISNIQSDGYRYNQANDTLIMSASDKNLLGLSDINDARNYEFSTEEANKICKLLKYNFGAYFFSAAAWGLDKSGNVVRMDWYTSDINLTYQGSAGSGSVDFDTAVAGRSELYNYTGTLGLGIDLVEESGLEYFFDFCFNLTYNFVNHTKNVAVEPRHDLGQQSELKVYEYSRIKTAAMQSIAFSAQYEKALNDFVNQLNKAIDVQL